MKQKIHLVGNAHLDISWLWKWEEGLQEIRATFASALDRIKEHNEFVFTSACAYYYSLVEETDPGLFKRIQDAVKSGRWRIVGGWWLQPDCNAPAGESFVRHGLYSQRFFREKFGIMSELGYNVDSFGHNGNLPQILKKSGMGSYVFMRPLPQEKNLPRSLFSWEGIDGTRVLAFRLLCYCSEAGTEEMIRHIQYHADAAEKEGTPFMCFYGVGNHGGGPTRRNLAAIDELILAGKNMAYSDPLQYFEEAAKTANIPVVKDELQYSAIGCFSVLNKVKRANNNAEQGLLSAEKMLAVLGGENSLLNAGSLREGWKKVLANQFHDSLGGCSIYETYPALFASYGWAQETASYMAAILLQRLSAGIAVFREGSTLVIWNHHPWEVRQAVEILSVADGVFDLHGKAVPFERVPSTAVADGREVYSQMLRFNVVLPPLGYTSYRLENYRPRVNIYDFLYSQYSRTASNRIESGDWEAVIDRETGFIGSLRNKKTGVEFLGAEGIGPVVLDDESDTWTHGISSYRGAKRKMALESYTLVCNGPVSAEYEIVYKLFDSKVIIRAVLNGEMGTLDLKTRVIWNEHYRLLKLRIGTAFNNETFVSEIPYGAIERAADGREWPIQRWVSLSDGKGPVLGVINDGVYSCSAERGDLYLTLLRSPVYAHHEVYHPRPDIQHRYADQGEADFIIQLRPYAGGAGNDAFARHALELNQAAAFVVESAHEGTISLEQSFCRVREGSSVLISVIKRAEDNDGWVIRAVEAGGKNTAAEIDFTWLGVSGSLNFAPWEIKTIKISDSDRSISETNLLEMQY
jgi:alpha-mannosidase